MISWNLGWVWISLGLVLSKWVLLGYRSIMVRLRDVIEVVIIEEMRLLSVYWID
jgi:hypothetical protein